MALVATSGLLLLLFVFGMSFLSASRVTGAREAARSGQRAAGLLAESGLHYAGARLGQGDGFPRFSRTRDDRGDDWTFRDGWGTSVEGASNPSWARGDHWIDTSTEADRIDNDGDGSTDEPGEIDRIRFPGETVSCDIDADGRFSAWSGRLREGGRGLQDRFVLKVLPCEGGIPVNAGWLDAASRDYPPDAVPDHRDPDVDPYHAGLVHALNNLGVTCGVTTRRWDAPCGTQPAANQPNWIQCSWLGRDLIENRPLGGYPSAGAIRSALKGIGYTEGDCRKILPFLDLGTGGSSPEAARTDRNTQAPKAPCMPVNLTVAPGEVLQALWMYWSLPRQTALDFSMCSSAALAVPCAKTGPAGDQAPYGQVNYPFIDPEEARRISGLVASMRQGTGLSWQGLERALLESAGTLFVSEFSGLSGAGFPLAARHWTQAKAELAFQVVTLDPFPGRHEGSALAAWACGGCDRDGDGANGIQPERHLGFNDLRIVAFPAFPMATYDDPADPADNELDPFLAAGAAGAPQGGTLGPPVLFDVESSGISGASGARNLATGRLAALERLDFASQEDFENLTGGKGLLARGVRAVEDLPPQTRHDRGSLAVPDLVGGGPGITREQNRIVTLPRWNRRAVTTATGETAPYWGFARASGAIALAGRESGRQGARLYWAFKDDFDGRPNNTPPGGYTPGPNGDFWHEGGGPGFPPPPGGPFEAWITPAESLETTHLQVDGRLKCRLPGWSSGVGSPGSVSGMLEAWLSPVDNVAKKNMMVFHDGDDGYVDIGMTRAADPADPLKRGSLFSAKGSIAPGTDVNHSFFVPDEDGVSAPVSWSRHFVLVIQPPNPPTQTKTKLRFFVDGVERPDVLLTGDMTQSLSGQGQWMYLLSADEFKVTGTLPPDDAALASYVAARHLLGRFVREGTFTSPLYVLDGAASFENAQWAGIIPDGIPGIPLSVEVEAYATAPGEPGHPALAWSASLGPSGPVADLSGRPAVRSFRYFVRFDANAFPGVLKDSPVFESVWFSFRRPSRAGRWQSWLAGI